jgi:hypothetical protein
MDWNPETMNLSQLLFHISWLSQVFRHSYRKLTNIPPSYLCLQDISFSALMETRFVEILSDRVNCEHFLQPKMIWPISSLFNIWLLSLWNWGVGVVFNSNKYKPSNIRKQQSTTLRFHLTPVRIAIISNTTNNKHWWGFGGKRNLLTLLVGM